MTLSSKEIARLRPDLDPRIVGCRKWRRERGLTVASMATMLGVTPATLHRIEHGSGGDSADEYMHFVARWQRARLVQDEIDEHVHRTKMRYRAAAVARNKHRSDSVG